MLSTASQYTGVLSAAAAQAQTAAAQAQTFASAFESAVAATVHPMVVSANRNQLVELVVSNLFGQNAPAIAATEAQYEEMWAADVSAMVGYHGGAAAAAAQLTPWSAALPSLGSQVSAAAANPLGAVEQAASAAVGATPAASVLQTVEGVFGSPLGTLQQVATGLINAPTNILFGRPLIGTGSITGIGAAAATGTLGGAVTGGGSTATVPITQYGTEAIVNASVGSGGVTPLLVDTGSTGLVIPYQNVGGLFGLLQAGFPHNIGIGGYSGGIDYLFATYNMPVNFGGGVVTQSTPVNVELFAFPTSLQSAMQNGWSFQSYFQPDGVQGVLGLGPNAGGPGPSIPTTAFANPAWNQGVLVNEPAGQLVFGGPPTGLGTPVTVSGAPVTTLGVQVGNGAIQQVGSIVDSGGVEGTIPASVIGNAPVGTEIHIYANGTDLYNYTYAGGQNAYYPEVISSGLMNTGYAPYSLFPTYLSNTADTTTFYT
ncbi:hypothetical protein MPRM_12100 [Mycobacterium parmense]|uniref:PPE family protein n=2 Tax=Mycobacterium parmense TaxID=185642 RepID=A0A7I7YQH8_9MYCO|nr:hypothetical protein MPRM_12100 [Mycobacterium parmense]